MILQEYFGIRVSVKLLTNNQGPRVTILTGMHTDPYLYKMTFLLSFHSYIFWQFTGLFKIEKMFFFKLVLECSPAQGTSPK